MTHPVAPDDVLYFWFQEHTHDDWFGGKEDFDTKVISRFTATHARAAACELWAWRGTVEGRLAEIIVLDQFSRQIFRGEGRAFASDHMALVLAQELVARGGLDGLTNDQRIFALLPYMHSESLALHEAAVPLFEKWTDENTLKFELAHRDTIVRFGRYPKRNAALGRDSTAEERAYIADSGDRMF